MSLDGKSKLSSDIFSCAPQDPLKTRESESPGYREETENNKE